MASRSSSSRRSWKRGSYRRRTMNHRLGFGRMSAARLGSVGAIRGRVAHHDGRLIEGVQLEPPRLASRTGYLPQLGDDRIVRMEDHPVDLVSRQQRGLVGRQRLQVRIVLEQLIAVE